MIVFACWVKCLQILNMTSSNKHKCSRKVQKDSTVYGRCWLPLAICHRDKTVLSISCLLIRHYVLVTKGSWQNNSWLLCLIKLTLKTQTIQTHTWKHRRFCCVCATQNTSRMSVTFSEGWGMMLQYAHVSGASSAIIVALSVCFDLC